jgi:hypothetical protein
MSEISSGQPLALQLILEEATKQARRHFRAIYLPVAIPVSIASGALPFAQSAFYKNTGFGSSRPPDISVLLPSLGLFLLSVMFFVLVYGLGHGALLVAAVDALAGRPISMKRAWLTMISPRVLGTLLLSWLAAAAGFICCVLPGIYVTLLLCLVVPVVVDEGLAGSRALGRSRELMEYNPRRDFGSDPRLKAFLILLTGLLLGYVLSFVVQLPAVVIQQVVVMRGVASGQRTDPASLMASLMWLHVPTSMIAVLAQTAVRLYVSFCIALLFLDARRRKEGADLEGAIASLGARQDPQG